MLSLLLTDASLERSWITVFWVILATYEITFELKETWINGRVKYKMIKHQRDNVKTKGNKNGQGWRRLKRIKKNISKTFQNAQPWGSSFKSIWTELWPFEREINLRIETRGISLYSDKIYLSVRSVSLSIRLN